MLQLLAPSEGCLGCAVELGRCNRSRIGFEPRYRLPSEYEKLNFHDLIVGFLSSARKDGYIADEEYNVLLGAADHMHKEAGGQRKNDQSAEKPVADFKTAHHFGFLDEKAVEGHTGFWQGKGEKVRGSFKDQSFADPKVTKILNSGVDCEAQLHDKGFNCHAHNNIQEDASIIVYGFMHPVNYLGYYRMPGEKLKTWLQAIGEQYNSDVPYHNWKHALDVFQLSFLVLTDGNMSEYFNHQDCCALLIAAIAHDVGHEGVNNGFHVKAQTKLASIYNDKCPLENMHASLTFETLRKPQANFLELLPTEDFQNVRTKIIDAILATDPTHHFPFTDSLTARLKSGRIPKKDEVPEDQKEANKTDRSLLLEGFVHMWDIGNAFRPWDVYKKSVDFLEQEFFSQGDREQSLGLPITVLMDRNKDRLAAGQNFFLGKLVLPLFDLYGSFIKQELATLFRSRIKENDQRWKELIHIHGVKPACDLLAREGAFVERFVG